MTNELTMTNPGDKSLDCIDVTAEYLEGPTPSLLAVTASGAPTWAQVYALAHKQLATWAKGRHYENSNMYTDWYRLVGPFCFIGVSWVLAHAGSSESAGLALIGGKKAYVPYIRNISGYHSGHSGMKVGAIVAVNSFNHIGFCVAVSGSTFDLLSFNSTSGSSDDAVTVKRYSLSYASGYVNLKYASAAPPKPADPNKYPGKIYKYVKSSYMHDSHVKWIQQHLITKGFLPEGADDSSFGPKTRDAVEAFQKKAGLVKDGEVGSKTWAALAK